MRPSEEGFNTMGLRR